MWEKTLWVGAGGFLGSNARYWLGGWLAERLGSFFPYHTLIINVSGSFLLGLFMTLSLQLPWHQHWRWGFAVGFLGGYTTFSTYEYESLNLLTRGQSLYAAGNLGGSLILGLIGAWLGVVAGRLLTRGLF